MSDSSDDDHDDDYEEYDLSYPMSSSPKGICLIINNRIFYQSGPQSEQLETRDGTDVDRDALKHTFEGLDFRVECRDNLTNTEMIHTMFDMAKEKHERFDCFVCCILSHGREGMVFGSNGVPVLISLLTQTLKPESCPSLTGKPKVFIIQACQGTERQRGYRALQSDAGPELPELIPNEADFLLAYSTVPGFRSFRDPVHGSVYIQKLAKTLKKHPGLDISEILSKVNYAVGRRNNKLRGEQQRYKQSPAHLFALRKKLSFGPGIQVQNPTASVGVSRIGARGTRLRPHGFASSDTVSTEHDPELFRGMSQWALPRFEIGTAGYGEQGSDQSLVVVNESGDVSSDDSEDGYASLDSPFDLSVFAHENGSEKESFSNMFRGKPLKPVLQKLRKLIGRKR